MGERPGIDALKASVGGLRFVGDLGPKYGVEFTFSPSLAILAGKVDKLGMDIRSFREPLTRAIKQVVIPSIKQNFAAEGRPAWVPLNEDTLSVKNWKGYPPDILRRTGKLAKVAAQQNIWTINEKAAAVKSLPESVFYGMVMQAGGTVANSEGASKYSQGTNRRTAGRGGRFERMRQEQLNAMRTGKTIMKKGKDKRGSGNIPARPFIMLQAEDEEEIGKVFAKWLDERVERTWGK